MNRIVRAALTQTRNAYSPMPATIEELGALAGRLDDIRDANLAHHRGLIEAASDMGVQILCMGELFTGPYFALDKDPMWIDLAEDASCGPSIRYMQALASDLGMVPIVHVGLSPAIYHPAWANTDNPALIRVISVLQPAQQAMVWTTAAQRQAVEGYLADGFPEIFSGVMDSVTYDGHQWAVPLDVNNLLIGYNTDATGFARAIRGLTRRVAAR